MEQKREVRWMVTYLPYEEQKALAMRRGMKDQDDGSLWDYIEPDECEREVGPFTNFRKAVAKAKALVPCDSIGETRVEEQWSRLGDYGKLRWDTLKYWAIMHDTAIASVKRDQPDGAYDETVPSYRDPSG